MSLMFPQRHRNCAVPIVDYFNVGLSPTLFDTMQCAELSTALIVRASTAVACVVPIVDHSNIGLSCPVLFDTMQYAELSTGLVVRASTAVACVVPIVDHSNVGLSCPVLFDTMQYAELSTGLVVRASTAVAAAAPPVPIRLDRRACPTYTNITTDQQPSFLIQNTSISTSNNARPNMMCTTPLTMLFWSLVGCLILFVLKRIISELEFKRLGFAKRKDYREFKTLNFSSKEAYMASRTCQICSDDIPVPEERLGCEQGHNLCMSCAVGTIQNALGDSASYIHPEGIRCVKHPTSLGGCRAFLNEAFVERVHRVSRHSDQALSQDQVTRLKQFISDANISAALPPESLVLCPYSECNKTFWCDRGEDSASSKQRCPNCSQFICLDCLVPYHRGLTCAESRRQRASNSHSQTLAYVQATTKPCPGCGARTSHFHGHECHHISPGGGCTNCHTHWCYACGATEEENVREREARNRCRCESAYWSTFCKNTRIDENLVHRPYPHDRRCGCPICPECRPGRPCPSCYGECVVCLGLVNPGPSEL